MPAATSADTSPRCIVIQGKLSAVVRLAQRRQQRATFQEVDTCRCFRRHLTPLQRRQHTLLVKFSYDFRFDSTDSRARAAPEGKCLLLLPATPRRCAL